MKQGQNLFKFESIVVACNQRGQAMVEYVLLLVVIVSMVLAASGLFSGANQFIDEYVGKYFTCLMDHGELPKLSLSATDQSGNSTEDLTKHTASANKCDARFSIANGATLTGRGSTGRDGQAGRRAGSTNAAANSTNKNSKSSSASGVKNGNRSSSDSLSSSTSSAAANTYAGGRINRAGSGGTADGSNGGATNKTKVIDEESEVQSAFSGRGNLSSSQRTEYRLNRRRQVNSGKMYDEALKSSKAEKPKNLAKKIAEVTAEEGFRPGPRKNAFTPPVRKTASANEEDTTPDFSFGSLLKWLMISGMVIAIIIFFGGQILNYSNSE